MLSVVIVNCLVYKILRKWEDTETTKEMELISGNK